MGTAVTRPVTYTVATFTTMQHVCALCCWCLQKKSGNVIVFLGNESPLGIPKQPIVFENARRLNALVILVEHRYYGKQGHTGTASRLLT